MATVQYLYDFDYGYVGNQRFPVLQVALSSPGNRGSAVQVDAYLDSGAQRSLFQGWISQALGLELLDGPLLRYATTARYELEARLHTVEVSHPRLGGFVVRVGFSTSDISRNLLGRDFFDFIQIGFRERHLSFYVTPNP